MKQRILAYARAMSVVGAMSVLVAGATYAALGSDVTLTGNTITSASADLKVSNGAAYGESVSGFTVAGLVPGQESKEYPFYFKNESDFAMALSAKVTSPFSFTGFNGTSVSTHEDAVAVKITNKADGKTTDKATLGDLRSASGLKLPGATLASKTIGKSEVPNVAGNYTITFTIDPNKVGGKSAGVGAFDIVFSGLQDTSKPVVN